MEMPGFSLTSAPGTVRLPYSAVLLALPDGAKPIVEILASNETTRTLQAPLMLSEQPKGVEYSSDGLVVGGAFIPAIQEIPLDREVVMLEELGIVRGVRLARLVYYPALPAGDLLNLTTHLTARVNFNQPTELASTGSASSDSMSAVIKSAVVNPEQVQISTSDSSFRPQMPSLQLVSSSTAAIEISHRGMVEISRGDLKNIGFPTDIDPAKIKITRDGTEIALDWQGDGDVHYEAGEKIRFFADPRFNRYSASDLYLISVGNKAGKRMGDRSAAPGGVTAGTVWVEAYFEENHIYTPDCFCPIIPAGHDGDRWVWDRLQRPSLESEIYPFTMPGYDNSQPAELTLWLIGFTDVPANPDHKVNVSLQVKKSGSVIQNVNLGTVQWNGKKFKEFTFNVPAGLVQGNYKLALTLPGISGVGLEGVWLDAFSVRYARLTSSSTGVALEFSGESSRRKYTIGLTSTAGDQVLGYDVNNPDQPVILNGIDVLTNSGQYAATLADPLGGGIHNYWLTMESEIYKPDNLRILTPTRLGAGFSGVDYLIISPSSFIPSLADLVQLRQSQGYLVAIEDVQAIYDNYGDGRPLPSAIHTFLEHAYFNWDQAPTHVLLVGDGTHDPKRYRPTSTKTIIPAFLADVDPWSDETASDNRYVTVDPKDDQEDILPDMIIGRLPVNNVSELNTIVSKILTYESQSNPNTWEHQALFVADNPDSAGNFPLLTDTLINDYPTPPFAPQKLYYSPDQWSAESFNLLIDSKWDAGSGVIMFTGHSSIFQWAHEILLHRDNVPNLANQEKLPVVLEMTCFTGSFQVPDFPTLDEDLVRHPDGGAVATWGSTGLGVATGHHWLAEGFMSSIYQSGGSDIGSATLAGKLNLATSGANEDLIDTFTLLGDPAIMFESSFSQYLPLSQK